VYPNGLGTEGLSGETADTRVAMEVKPRRGVDFLLENGSRFATFITFEKSDRPTSWGDAGFLWGGVMVKDYNTFCQENGQRVDQENCELGSMAESAHITHEGTMNEQDRVTVEQILSSFRLSR